MSPSRLLSFVRDARWFDGERGRGYSLIFLALLVAGAASWLWRTDDLIAPSGAPIGSDFLSFYAASKLFLAGHPADAWNNSAHQAAEAAVFGKDFGNFAFFYPPPFLLLCAPLALMPYGVAVSVWLGLTTAGAVVCLWRLLRDENRAIGWVPILALPVLWMNLGSGQNGALTCAILAGGCLFLDRRPIAAGLILGLLVIKPQMATALPFLLAASGRWKTFFATGLSALALLGLSYLVIGAEGFTAFLHSTGDASRTLNNGFVPPGMMLSLFAALRVLGAPLVVAYGLHALVAVAVLGTAAWTAWRYKPDVLALAALIAAATPLLSPFILEYDLVITAISMGWLVLMGARYGFQPWEKLALLGLFILPLLARKLALEAHLPLAPVVLLPVFWLVVRRIWIVAPKPTDGVSA